MTFCSYCKSLQATVFGEAVQSLTYNLQRYSHHPSYTSLSASAEAGCGLCNILIAGLSDIDELKKNVEIKFSDDGHPIYPSGTVSLGGLPGIAGERWIWIDKMVGAAGSIRAYELPKDWRDPWNNGEMDANEKAVAAIDFWTKSCLADHPECQQNRSDGFIPTRVIDVGSDGDDFVRLVQTSREKLKDKRYIALSHCWGTNMPTSATTIEAVINEHTKSIPFARLTASFVDAIKMTRKLGIPYIWIDSLCIVQDSSSDWEAEASAMAAIYTGAYVTIAASGSSDGTQGCRIRKSAVPYIDVPINGGDLEPGNENQRRYRVCAWPLFSSEHMHRDPLHSRGWCLQERELSPRIAHFSSDTVRWECRKRKATLVFPWHDSNSFLGHPRIFDYDETGRRHPKLNPTLNGPVAGDGLLQAASEWNRLVTLYAARKLTKQTDVLPGLGGIARVFADFTPGEYHAGHFVSHGVVGLLWIAEARNQKIKQLEEPRRPQCYTAPSWSWASIVGPVSWSWNMLLDKDRIEAIACIVEMKTDLQGRDRFGKITAGALKIEGQVQQLVARSRNAFWLNESSRAQDLFVNLKGKEVKVGSVAFDVSTEAQGAVYALACAKVGHPWPQVFGLALEAVGNTPPGSTFQRIGRFISATRIWDRNDLATETIIV
ncbi:heterokaryon incompatibility protein-domain-containing protein [Astrocystis sublimbata]|nr:heterokaryon incompatibility protein-domain-containing protein [Astrocystis sublimbata]